MSGYASSGGRRVAVLSSAQTELRTSWDDAQHIDLIGDAVSRCLEGVGIEREEIDFVIDSGSDVLDGRSISNCGFLGALGAHHKEEARVEEDGLWAALYGCLKIAGGGGDVGLIVAYSKSSEADLRQFWTTQAEPFLQRPTGIDQTTASGLQASQYLARGSADEAVLARVAEYDWARAAADPTSGIGTAPGEADIAASAVVADPLRALTVSRPVDGAVAMLIATEEIARRFTPDPVLVWGMGAAMDQHMLAQRAPGRFEACEAAAAMAYRTAGLDGPPQVSLAEISGASAAAELMVVEALGLTEGPPQDLFADGAPVDVNPSGGALPADPVMATGLVRLSEATRRLARQVPDVPSDATTALVHGAGGLGMQNHCVFLIRR